MVVVTRQSKEIDQGPRLVLSELGGSDVFAMVAREEDVVKTGDDSTAPVMGLLEVCPSRLPICFQLSPPGRPFLADDDGRDFNPVAGDLSSAAGLSGSNKDSSPSSVD